MAHIIFRMTLRGPGRCISGNDRSGLYVFENPAEFNGMTVYD
jgi:hypothetical protein